MKINNGEIGLSVRNKLNNLPVADPQYTNEGGTGDRTLIIRSSVSTTLLNSGVASNLVDGVFGNNASDAIAFAAVSVAGLTVSFDFGRGARKSIQEAKWYQSGTNAHGTWKWQGSLDNSNWEDIGSSFTLGGATIQTQTELSTNKKAFRYYRLLGVSGTASGSPWVQEIEFKIDGVSADKVYPDTKYVFQDIQGGSPAYLSKMISAWTFDEKDGDTVYDRFGFNDIDLTTPTNPNATRTAQGIKLEAGLIQTPSISSFKQIVILYKTGLNQSGGFIISGGNAGSGAGITQDNIASVDTVRYAGSGYGFHAVKSEASGAKAYELNRGGWGLLSRGVSTAETDVLGLGGRHSTTTSRCANFEIAMAFAFNATLTTTEEEELLFWVRREAVKRGIYIVKEDCPIQTDAYLVTGESNADGRSTITDLSAADQAAILSRKTDIIPANNSINWPQFDGFELGYNQQTTAPTLDFGPEFGVAFQRKTDFVNQLKNASVIKFAKGSTFLAPSPTIGLASSWNTANTQDGLYWQMVRHLQRAFQELLTRGIGWGDLKIGFWIGLNDALSTTYTVNVATYQGYLQDFLDEFSVQFPNMVVSMDLFRAHAADPSSNPTALADVRTASDNLGTANANVTTYNTDSYGLEPDGVHYNAAGSKAMGIILHG